MKLEKWLKSKKLSKTEFAKQLGYSRNHIQLIVNGKRIASTTLILKIREFTDGKVKLCDMVG